MTGDMGGGADRLAAKEEEAARVRERRLLDLGRREGALVRRDAERERLLGDFQALAWHNLALLDDCEAAMPNLLRRAGVDGEELRLGTVQAAYRMVDRFEEEARLDRRRLRDEEDRIEEDFHTAISRLEDEAGNGSAAGW
ncbi:hypothetical protein [Olsenella sp. Marseille-P4559]|uniref:hypothetical protein n=1 Tax=Olsenella sp. Marseille-P4559 TaxID=2364795 RepID=UPI00103094D9|nr:hypothetical protein [Olsenella sp. Marseille-P4559]